MNGYVCSCRPGYAGDNCQISKYSISTSFRVATYYTLFVTFGFDFGFCFKIGFNFIKACLFRTRPRTRIRRSRWIACKQFVWIRLHQRGRPRTTLEIGSCGKSQDCLWSKCLGDGRANFLCEPISSVVFVELGPSFTRLILPRWK